MAGKAIAQYDTGCMELAPNLAVSRGMNSGINLDATTQQAAG